MVHAPIHVLLIDSDTRFAERALDVLPRAGRVPLHLRVTSTLQAALERLKVERYDVILIDPWLPDGSGREALHALRSSRYDGPVVAITARASDEVVDALILAGAQDCLPKGLVPWTSVARALHHAVEHHRLERSLRQAQRLEAVGRLAGSLAHDFNNLLTIILGYAEVLELEPDLTDLQRDHAREIRKAGERGAALTTKLLSFSRRPANRPIVVDVNDVVADIEPMMSRVVGDTVQLSVETAPGPLPARIDPFELQQIIINLTLNARDAMPKGGHLRISTGLIDVNEPLRLRSGDVAPGTYAALAVEDTGTGIAPEDLDRVFEPFFTTKPENAGTGLGLASVWDIVRSNGGHVDVESHPGRGALFTLYLPLSGESPHPLAGPRAGTPPAGGSETILVVEDDPSVLELLSEVLSAAGYRVLAAHSVPEATDQVDEQGGAIDLLLTDVLMFGESGGALAERLRHQRPDLPALYMSGHVRAELIERGLIDETTPFVQKPFSQSGLLYRIRTLLDGGEPIAVSSATRGEGE